MKKSSLFVIFVTIFIVIIIGTIIFYRLLFIPSGIEIDKQRFPITGVDISGHTGKVDFVELSKQEIDFVFIKATEGDFFVDPKFEKNYYNSTLNRINVGFYHFFKFNKSGKTQAANYLKQIKGKKTNLPLVIDVEEWGNSIQNSTQKVIDEIRVFITLIEDETGKNVMIYSNESSFNKYINGHFDKNEIWICSFKTRIKINNKWTFWQHSHKGKFNGTEGYVDINTFNGNRESWEKYLENQTCAKNR